MANRPANAGSGGVGSGRGLAPLGDVTPPFDAAAPPLPVHHDAIPSAAAPSAAAPSAPAPSAAAPSAAPPSAAPRPPAGHRAAAPADRAARSADRVASGTSGLAWLPYLIVLTSTGVGMFVACQGSKYAGRGTGLVGCSLLAAALARLILPARYAGLLSSRRKASDVLAFAVLGAAVLAVALTLP
jgi:Protein of unknown function (DUF3017)